MLATNYNFSDNYQQLRPSSLLEMAVACTPCERSSLMKMGQGLIAAVDMDKENYAPSWAKPGLPRTPSRLHKRKAVRKSKIHAENENNCSQSVVKVVDRPL